MKLKLPLKTSREALKLIMPSFALNVISKSKFSSEVSLIEGKRISDSTANSVLFFTTHKCASTFMGRCMNALNKKYLRLGYADLGHCLHVRYSGDTYEYLNSHKQTLFHPQGIFYNPLREYVAVPEIEKYRTVLMLRDPRDVMVSSYYSMAYSHKLPANRGRRKRFMVERKLAQQQTVDEYVVGVAGDRFYETYTTYCDHLVKERNVTCLRYEDFMEDFDGWLDQLQGILHITITPEDRAALKAVKGGAGSGNKFSHIRKGTPGDYKNKLKPETQQALNAKFSDVLTTLNYRED